MDLSRQEYPALLVSTCRVLYEKCEHRLTREQRGLQPSQAVTVLDERVKLIAKVNNDAADFLAVRR